MKTELAITGVGMLTPAGLNVMTCLHEVRSGSSHLAVQRIADRARAPLTGGTVPTWTPTQRARRLQTLAERALRSAWRQACAAAGLEGASAGLILGAPEAARPGYRFPHDGFDGSAWAEQLGIHAVQVEAMAAGACAAQAGLHRAAQWLADSRCAACAIVAADNQLQVRIARWHEDNFRLKCSYLNDGLMPAEGAYCLVVETERAALARGARVLARISALAAAREHATILSAEPNAAVGLTAAVRGALRDAGLDRRAVGMVWSDLNGEGYRAREWALTEIRLAFETQTALLHPADCYGDLGAATDGNLIGLAALCQATGWSAGKPLLVIAGSDQGLRAACVIEPPRSVPAIPPVTRELPRVYSPAFDVKGALEALRSEVAAEDPQHALFDWQLRIGHKEDMAAIYYQREFLLQDASIPWPRIREPEQRILDHADAIISGGALSIAETVSGLTSDERGIAFGAAFLVGGLPAEANLDLLERALAGASDPRIGGIADALRHVPEQDALLRRLERWMEHDDSRIAAMALRVAADRRRVSGERILAALRRGDAALRATAAEAAWRNGAADAVPALRALLDSDQPSVRYAALRGLAILAPAATVPYCRAIAADGDADAMQILALLGSAADAGWIAERTQVAGQGVSACLALGVLGHPATVSHLLAALRSEDPQVPPAAAQALELISGQRLREKANLAEETDLGGGERDIRTREIECVAMSHERWAAWWEANRAAAGALSRLRRGQPFSAAVCAAEMEDPKATFEARARAYKELLVVSRVAVPFEPDWFVARQARSLARWRKWIEEHPA